MKVMITNAFGRSNRGDSVLLDECIAEVRAVLPTAEISCSVFEGIESSRAVHPNVRWSERIGNSTGHGIRAKIVTLWLIFIAIIATIPGLGWVSSILPKTQHESWKRIREADIVISAPGGYIHDTNFAYYVALLHIALARRSARSILAPQSIGPIDSLFARLVARRILMGADAICARESYTFEFLTDELRLPTKILRRSGDSAFWNYSVSASNDAQVKSAWDQIGVDPEAGDPILGLTVVDWNFPKSENATAARELYVDGLAAVIDHLSSEHGMRAVIFNQVSEDLGMAARVAATCKSRVAVDTASREPEILRSLIGSSTLFIGTRFHSCIFAMMANCPTLAIAYLPKTSYILKDLDLDHRQVSIDNFDAKRALLTLEKDLSDLRAASWEIEEAVSVYRKSHAQLRDVLAEET
ncbi:polysaccharide pyruvyl transferase family protein [Sulfitobacter sp. W002]|uniref:polysaccharide pyruvyl transferase family protein n=1 Tax=Sulfitobacter sp. W002 TaxID=2867024 RepID=UPI0021A87E46|nr:polysaccharide pyruvyl transferase family protein [Sulfitobacter sp. W002]UWR30447.1 polysaccharide pyruvyl transferase family protein [Sulfitobacter sp. W002]